MNNNYNPTPIDVSNVMLSAELEKLATLLAANVHDTWALGRMKKEGWSYAPQREEAKKETPCMVPFEELTDSEKAYDFNAALDTLKVLVKLGYSIIPPQDDTAK